MIDRISNSSPKHMNRFSVQPSWWRKAIAAFVGDGAITSAPLFALTALTTTANGDTHINRVQIDKFSDGHRPDRSLPYQSVMV